MSKLVLNDISTEFRGQVSINENFTDIEQEFQNKVLYRNNPDGEPNQMENNLDMNSKRILNLPDALTGPEPVTLNQLSNYVDTSFVSNYINFLSFGAEGDGVTDDTSAIQAAIDYAASLVQSMAESARPTWAGNVVIDGFGYNYLVKQPINMNMKGGVWLKNAKFTASSSSWTTTGSPVLRLGRTNNSVDRYAGIENVNIECNFVADGVYVENAREIKARGVDIHGFVNYGFRAFGVVGGGCRFEDVRALKYWFNEPGITSLSGRVGVGISSEVADNQWHRCAGTYCKYPISIEGPGSHIFSDCHPFNGNIDDIPKWDIQDVTSNGAGSVKVIVSSITGLVNGDRVVAPWLRGISSESAGSRPGVYPISLSGSTAVTFEGYLHTGTWSTHTASPSFILWRDEPTTWYIKKERASDNEPTRGVMLVNCQSDNGKVLIENGAQASLTGMYLLKSSEGSNRVAIEFISDEASASLAGIQINNGIFSILPYRFTGETVSDGFATNLRCSLFGGVRTGGVRVPSIGQCPVWAGNFDFPGIIFTETTDSEDIDLTDVTIKTNTGLYSPEAGKIGFVMDGNETREFSYTRDLRRFTSSSYRCVDMFKQTITASASVTYVRFSFTPSTGYNIGGKVKVTGYATNGIANSFFAEVAFSGYQATNNTLAISLSTETKVGDTTTVPQATLFTTNTGTNYVDVQINTKSLLVTKQAFIEVEHSGFTNMVPTVSIVTQ